MSAFDRGDVIMLGGTLILAHAVASYGSNWGNVVLQVHFSVTLYQYTSKWIVALHGCGSTPTAPLIYQDTLFTRRLCISSQLLFFGDPKAEITLFFPLLPPFFIYFGEHSPRRGITVMPFETHTSHSFFLGRIGVARYPTFQVHTHYIRTTQK